MLRTTFDHNDTRKEDETEGGTRPSILSAHPKKCTVKSRMRYKEKAEEAREGKEGNRGVAYTSVIS